MKKRVLAIILSASMLLAAVPAAVFAADTADMTDAEAEIAAQEEPADSEETGATDGESVQSDEVTEDTGTESGMEERKSASAEAENFEYTEDDSGIIITKYTGSESEVIIPGQINGKDVVAIGSSAFADCSSLTSIKIPDSVTSIGVQAFMWCDGLTNITIPGSVMSIGDEAFWACSDLTSITISNSVTSIGVQAFSDCGSLSNIVVDADNKQYTSKAGILYNKNQAELICCPGGKKGSVEIPNSVTSIEDNAFFGCRGLTSITFLGSVTSIGEGAFGDCSGLTSITIPNSVTSIRYQTFAECSDLTSITIPNSVTSIGEEAFIGCDGLTNITIPDSVTSIETGAFSCCSSLTSITIPDGVTSIGDSVFELCGGLTSVTIPDGVTSIGDKAFRGCSGLTSITIPDSVTSIEKGAFFYCSGLTSIVIPDSVTSIGNWAFEECESLKDVYYTGTESEWKAISIGEDNEDLTNATIHYNYSKQEFSDVTDTTHPYYNAIHWAADNDITTGFSDGTFKPYDNCTRGQVVTFLWRLAGKPEPSSSTKAQFSDMVTSSHPYYKAILWAVEKGITTGFSDGTFKPFDNCSRGQIVTFIYRYAGNPSISGKTANFKDMVSSGHPFYNPIVWASSNGITTGFSDNTFGPAQKCTRGQVVTFLYRYSK